MEWIGVHAMVEGVTIGVLISVVLGFYHGISKRRARREQLKYLRDIIDRGYQGITGMSQLGGVDVHTLRLLEFEIILRDMNMAIAYRTDRLSYAEQYEMKKIVLDVTSLMKELKPGRQAGEQVPKKEFYAQPFFAKASKLRWLKWNRERGCPVEPHIHTSIPNRSETQGLQNEASLTRDAWASIAPDRI